MIFNPAVDLWIWSILGAFFVLMGIRAWIVETGQGRLGRQPAKVKVLNGAIAGVIGALVVMLTIQGGALLVNSIVTRTDPSKAVAQQDPNAPPPAAGQPGAQPPAAPPAGG